MNQPDKQQAIANKCPSCGWESLFIGTDGWITCGNITDCKYPDLDEAIAQRVAAEVAAARIDELKALPRSENDNGYVFVSEQDIDDRIQHLTTTPEGEA